MGSMAISPGLPSSPYPIMLPLHHGPENGVRPMQLEIPTLDESAGFGRTPTEQVRSCT